MHFRNAIMSSSYSTIFCLWLYSVHFTMMPCTLYTVQWCPVFFTVYTYNDIMYSVQCTNYNDTLYSVHCTMMSCTVYSGEISKCAKFKTISESKYTWLRGTTGGLVKKWQGFYFKYVLRCSTKSSQSIKNFLIWG